MTKTSLSILLALSAVPSLAQTSYTNPEKSSDVACFGLPCFVKAKRTSPEFVKTSWDPYCQQIGNTTFGSEGSSAQRIGKATFISDGGATPRAITRLVTPPCAADLQIGVQAEVPSHDTHSV